MTSAAGGKVALLGLDPGLAHGLDPIVRRSAEATIGVSTAKIPRGPWRPPAEPPEQGFVGYLIVEGILVREVTVAGERSLELLSGGDLTMPWHEDAASFVAASWRAVTPLRVAEIDARAGALLARHPELATALLRRVMDRSRALAVYAAIAGMPGLRGRIVVLFWQLAERWGERTPEGVRLPLKLTHQMLADLVGAKRPSVSSALGELAREGVLVRTPSREWLLHGDPPDVDAWR